MFKRWSLFCIVAILSAGCATPTPYQIQSALDHTDQVWKANSQQITRELGTKKFPVDKNVAYDAAIATANSLGFSIEKEDRSSDLLYIVAPAPNPLTLVEWEEAKKFDEPQFKDICRLYIGGWGDSAKLHIDGVEIHAIVAIHNDKHGAIVSVIFNMLDKKVRASGYRPVTYAPPTVSKIGLYKFWSVFQKELVKIQKERPSHKKNKRTAQNPKATGSGYGCC